MKSLVATAVFGLLPLPPMDDTAEHELGSASREITCRLDRAFQDGMLPQPYLERRATKAELARLREELRAAGRH
jgi:hypothetical protein